MKTILATLETMGFSIAEIKSRVYDFIEAERALNDLFRSDHKLAYYTIELELSGLKGFVLELEQAQFILQTNAEEKTVFSVDIVRQVVRQLNELQETAPAACISAFIALLKDTLPNTI